MEISHAVEDYLKAIYKLQLSGEGRVTTNSLAERLGVSPASVTGMVKRLAQLKLLRHARYRGFELTTVGEKMALEVIRHHRLLELYLTEVVGMTWDQVDAEAEKLEHVISEEFEECISQALGDPTHDCHGDPIPTKEGTVPSEIRQSLWDTLPGQDVKVQRVSDGDPELLRYLAELGLVPDAPVNVVHKARFDGPLTIRVGAQSHILGEAVASAVWVRGLGSEH